MSGPPSSDALDAWVRETAPRAVAYARSLLGDPDRAEDVVQDCYCRLLAHAGRYDLPRDGLKLLLRAVTNACINATTRRRRLARLGGEEAAEPPDPAAVAPDEGLLHRELSDAVGAALATLPANQRAAVQLKALGHSQQEIALALAVSPSNAGVLVHRGRQALAAALAPFLGGEAVA